MYLLSILSFYSFIYSHIYLLIYSFIYLLYLFIHLPTYI